MNIARDFTGDVAYRVGVWACPHCDWGSHKTNDAWEKPENIREIIIRSDAPHSKANGIMISSECLKCFEKSYHHFSFDYCETVGALHSWPAKIIKAISKEKKNRIARGKETWNKSLCRKCSVKHTVEWGCLYPFVKCSSGSMGTAETKSCESFKKK